MNKNVEIINNLIKATLTLANATIAVYSSTIEMDADQEIKTANKVLTKYQLSKMAGRAGSTASSNTYIDRTSTAFNAYLVGLTSYNVLESEAKAHETSARAARKIMQTIMTALYAINVIVVLLMGPKIKIPILTILYLISIIDNSVTHKTIMHMINTTMAASWSNTVLETVFWLIEMFELTPSALKKWVSFFYLCSTITLLVPYLLY